jgi:hypothetical protein
VNLARNLKFVREELARRDISPGEKLVHVADRATRALRIEPHVTVSRRLLVQLTTPPQLFRGLRDLVVRRGTLEDLRPLATIDDTDPDLVRARFARGDFAYVGESDGELLCHTWFHRGPSPFEEDRTAAAAWALDGSSFWSYNGAAAVAARSSGVFVKVFQVSLREIFLEHGASRVLGFILDQNRQSLIMHERMGFTVLGAFSTVAVPGVRWHRWAGDGTARHWLAPRPGGEPLWLPPR